MLYVILILFICVLLWYWLNLLKINKRLCIQQHIMTEHRKEVSKQVKQMQQMQHRLLEYMSLFEQSRSEVDAEGLIAYENELKEYYSNLSTLDYSENIIVDAIIYDKMCIFRALGADVQIQIEDIDSQAMSETLLFDMFYQIFHVGIVTCKKVNQTNQRFFSIKTKTIAGQFVIKLECSVALGDSGWNKRGKCLKRLVRNLGGEVLRTREAESGMILLSIPLEREE